MSSLKKENRQEVVHSPAIRQIITSVPSWLLRWGIFIFFVLLFLVLGLSAFIRYPDMVLTTLKIERAADSVFYGAMQIPQNKLARVKEGQEVLIKLKRYPYETYGMIRGKIKAIDPVSGQDSLFISRVDFKNDLSGLTQPIQLKKGMTADAEIIIQDVSVMQRLSRSIFKQEH
ncbi:hypothetical protein TH53_09085 [Pedobacter lusitanus]|uniref:Contig34, whole genome shotgun sequence n=1 Tax=Pedobacter lusitanus TaxID=1503925 RepID=A0A0D0GSL8_9SPHI|nr:HlyD family secretion protein [Pedobacter lusitanus]KIO77426.1 hypothetical protein TH53_09085 [Pedobacter lusitanus]